MKRLVICFVVVGLLSLFFSNRADASAFATASAGNAESPLGNDFQEGGTSATVSASSTDPEFGTATADGTIVGPSLTYTGFAASFAGPAWIANASLDWNDTLFLTFPVDAITGPTGELTVEFIATFSWDIDSNGSYGITLGGLGAYYSTADGQQQDDFGTLGGSSGFTELSVISELETIQLDSNDNTQYLAIVGFSMQLIGHAGSGDWQHGSFDTAFAMHSLVLTDVIIHDGETEIEPIIEYGGDLEPQDTADFDDDGDVDGHDFLIWQRGFGITTGALLGDGDSNADGDVDGDDLGVWQAQYGEPGHLAGIGSVPEPGTLVLVVVAASALLSFRGEFHDQRNLGSSITRTR